MNVSNHIRKGAVIDVVNFHKEAILDLGLTLKDDLNRNASHGIWRKRKFARAK